MNLMDAIGCKQALRGVIVAVWLSAVLLLAGFVVPAAAAGDDTVYTANVTLDVSADNAVVAKERALQEGPLAALKVLFRRLAPFRAYDRLDLLKAVDAEKVLDGFSVRDEHNSPTRYIATIDYAFSRSAVDALLTRNGVPFFNGRSPKQVILPVLGRIDDPAVARAATEDWWQAWRHLDLKHALTDSRLYRGTTADGDDWQRIANGDKTVFQGLAARYSSNRLVAVAAAPDEAARVLRLHLFGVDAVGPIDYSQDLPYDPAAPAKSYADAAAVAFGILEGRWREPRIEGEVAALTPAEPEAAATNNHEGGAAVPAVKATAGARLVEETVFLRVAFNGMREWQDIRGRLQRVPGMRDLKVNSLSPRGADVRMTYPGGEAGLERQLSSLGFAIDRTGRDLVLRSVR